MHAIKAALWALSVVCAFPAYASIEYRFSGSGIAVAPELPATVAFLGGFTYNPDTTAAPDPNDSVHRRLGGALHLWIDFDGYLIRVPRGEILNSGAGVEFDFLGNIAPPLKPDELFLVFSEPSGSIETTGPGHFPVILDLFRSGLLSITFARPNEGYFNGRITALERVPEPGSAVLACFTVCAAFSLRRRLGG